MITLLNRLTGRQPRTVASITESGPCRRGFKIEPSDDHDLPYITKQLWIGKGGCLNITMANDSTPIRILGLKDSTMLDIAVRRIHSCDTAASRLAGFY